MEKYYSNLQHLVMKITVISPTRFNFCYNYMCIINGKKTLAESVEALNRCEARLFF